MMKSGWGRPSNRWSAAAPGPADDESGTSAVQRLKTGDDVLVIEVGPGVGDRQETGPFSCCSSCASAGLVLMPLESVSSRHAESHPAGLLEPFHAGKTHFVWSAPPTASLPAVQFALDKNRESNARRFYRVPGTGGASRPGHGGGIQGARGGPALACASCATTESGRFRDSVRGRFHLQLLAAQSR